MLDRATSKAVNGPGSYIAIALGPGAFVVRKGCVPTHLLCDRTTCGSLDVLLGHRLTHETLFVLYRTIAYTMHKV